ncbi:hypothetical protein FB446DRAFT_844598 [Lentinula raphanica]|nr:hypothetical protein FB446DRAFT_844598 [Lentinula raphanica]
MQIWKEIEMETQGSLGLVVIWIGVYQAGSTSPDLAHGVSQDILGLLSKNGVRVVVVEWREAVPQSTLNSTRYGRRFLTPLLGVPIAQGGSGRRGHSDSLNYENRDEFGIPATKVFRVSNCHVLCMRKKATLIYEYKDGMPMDHVRVCGTHRFQRGLDEICNAIADHGILAELLDPENSKAIRRTRRQLEEENEYVAELENLYNEIQENDWSQNRLSRNTGHVQYALAITVHSEGGTYYTSDWAAFLASEEKVKPQFQGNVVDLSAS